jgi:thioredoxin 1|tara:strand:- start:309 stop:635 length:327 start_codon:yes stop_codon:yes gene_type:complete
MINVNDNNFQKEVIDFDDLVFIDFWANWCGPCKMMSPKYNKASEDFSSKTVKFTKYEAGSEGCNDIAGEYNVRGLPTFLAIYKNQVVDTMVGAGDIQSFVRRNVDEWG